MEGMWGFSSPVPTSSDQEAATSFFSFLETIKSTTESLVEEYTKDISEFTAEVLTLGTAAAGEPSSSHSSINSSLHHSSTTGAGAMVRDPAFEAFLGEASTYAMVASDPVSAEEILKRTDEITSLLETYPLLRDRFESAVPEKIPYAHFWGSFFRRKEQFDAERKKRIPLRVHQDQHHHDDEEVKWDDGDDDEVGREGEGGGGGGEVPATGADSSSKSAVDVNRASEKIESLSLENREDPLVNSLKSQLGEALQRIQQLEYRVFELESENARLVQQQQLQSIPAEQDRKAEQDGQGKGGKAEERGEKETREKDESVESSPASSLEVVEPAEVEEFKKPELENSDVVVRRSSSIPVEPHYALHKSSESSSAAVEKNPEDEDVWDWGDDES
eukprot:ANDGO_00478.mRNA.1 hypothetical protein